VDSNGDGIGDTSYIINENNQDRFPFVNVIEFNSPPKDGLLNHDSFSELSSVIIGFITSKIGVIIVAVTLLIIGLIVTFYVIVVRKKLAKTS
jgi:hypothetical protein